MKLEVWLTLGSSLCLWKIGFRKVGWQGGIIVLQRSQHILSCVRAQRKLQHRRNVSRKGVCGIG